ncbi:hypothetical protein ZYGM_002047 [Zygosaccharomyces mellis]|uniref:Phospholipase C/D domain-containing protein n=1 Tax=Zygosaccharomyces mellis TaxID=42258 RepID=A0A4C2E0P8_9SACH|nr:hypothetical protein ZYGM_002047 [Zygosaccharomyces mellis]
MKFVSSWLGVTLLLVLIFQSWQVHGAGINTHLIYLARATFELDRKYEPWLKAGAFFPDAFYSCKPSKQWHNFAEAIHWPQFLVSAVELWHNKYEDNPQCEDALKLRSFLVGVFTHQIVDSSWHSLVSGYKSEGLLEVLSHTEFNGRTQEAHNFLDFLGDFIVLGNVIRDLHDDNWQFLTRSKWSVPKEEDMLDLVKCAGAESIEVNYEELQKCVRRGFLASIGEVLTLLENKDQVLNTAYQISPRARDMVQEHWLGGEFNLISLMQYCLPNLYNLFSHMDQGNSLGEVRLCGNLPPAYEIGVASATSMITVERRKTLIKITTEHPLSNLGTSLELGKFKNDNKLYLAIGAPLENGHGSVYLVSWEEIMKSKESDVEIFSNPTTVMIGAKIHLYQIEDTDFLIISEQSSNNIYFYHDDFLVLKVHLTPKSRVNRLEVTKVFDIDGDGIPDLILSGWCHGKVQEGCVVIIPGQNIAPNLRKGRSINDITILIDSSITVLKGGWWSQPYQHFGSAVEISASKFLYVACQSLGVVLVYSSTGLNSRSLPRFILKGDELGLANKRHLCRLMLVPSRKHGMFGRMIISWTYQGKHFVGISQHVFSTIFIYQEVYGFIRLYMKIKLPVELYAIPYSIDFGTDMKYSSKEEALYVSSPGYLEGLGAIWKIPMVQITKAAEFWKRRFLLIDPRKHLTVSGTDINGKGVGNYGKCILLGPQDKLVIGVPQYNYGVLEGKDQLTGMVLIS